MKLKRNYKVSLYVHIGVLIGITILPYLKFNKKKNLTAYKVKLVPLPAPVKKEPETKTTPKKKKIITEKPKPKKEKTQKPVVKEKKPEIIKKKIIKRQKKGTSINQRLKQRLEDFSEPEKQIIKKNKKFYEVKQSSTKITTQIDDPFMWYINIIQQKLDNCWNEPDTVFKGTHKVTLSFIIHRNGSVSNLYMVKKTQINKLNQSALDAVKLAQPFPPIPKNYPNNKITVTTDFNIGG